MPWLWYYFLFWMVPAGTSFAFFMILRQVVQHGNGGRGWLTNTRIFLVNRPSTCAVFPLGQDYHLPHHLFASVPHYRLKQLHELLLQESDEYRDSAVESGRLLPAPARSFRDRARPDGPTRVHG